jgi:tetratricopeptide (TPR) repeat protein
VDAVVEGTVLRSGNQVRITAQLVQAAEDRHLWAESYERDLRDVLALQGEVARDIAGHIEIKLTRQEQARLASPHRVNPEAYEAYLKGRHSMENWTANGMKLANRYFEQAVEKDPNYAQAYSGLADSCALLVYYGYMPPKSAYPKCRAAAVKSVAIDDSLAEAHTSLAAFKEYFDLDWPGAKSEFQRAIRLNPSYALAHDWYSDYLMNVGQAKEAAAEATIYKELDPLSPGSYAWMGQIFYFTRDYDRAIEQFQRALDLDPNHVEAHCRLGDAYTQKGVYKQARAELATALSLSGRNARFLAALGRSYAMSGKRSEAVRVLTELIDNYII